MKRVYATLLMLFACLVPVICVATNKVETSAAEPLCSFVAQAVTNLAPPVVAVVPFRHEDGSKSMEGELLCERLLTLLSGQPGVRVVERANLAKALEEQKLSAEGFISPETAVKAGKVSGAKAILTGTVTEMGDLVEINARLFSVESSEVIAARSVTARRAIKTFISPLWDDMDRIKATGNEFKAKVWTERDRLQIGDTTLVRFSVEKPCHVTIFDFATDGSITVLFPNRFQQANRVEPHRTYELPAENAGYKIRVRGPAGIEHLKLFATTGDIKLYERDYSQSPFSTVSDGDQEFIRGLQATVAGVAKSDWAEASCEFLIENVFRDAAGGERQGKKRALF